MKKYLHGALAALTLIVATSANAFPFVCTDCTYTGSGGNDNGKWGVVTWDNTTSDYDVTMEAIPNGNTPVWKFYYPNGVYLGSNKLVDLLAAKQDATASFDGVYSDLSGKPTLFSGSYTDLTGKPSLAAVATSGNYTDLSGKPTIPAAQINSDWTASSGVGQILNKPSLSTVATSGSYNDLTSKPTIPGNIPAIYNGTTLLTNPKIELLSGSTNSSGLVVFQLTADGTSTGTALFTNVTAINIDINASTALYAYSYAFSNSNKTLTVTVTSGTSLLSLGLLPTTAAASGVSVNARAFGN